MSALRQLRLMVVGTTIGAIGGSVVLRPSDDLGPVAIAATVGAILLGLSVVVQWFASLPISRLAPEYASLIGRVVVTLGATLVVVLAFDLLVLSDARSVPARPNAQTTLAPTAHSQIPNPIGPASSVAPIVPAAPQPSGRPPAPTLATSSAPQASVVPISSPAAASSESPPATPEAPPPATPPAPPPSPPPPTPATASPAQSVPPATPQQPTAIPAPTSVIPTLPPLPTIRLP